MLGTHNISTSPLLNAFSTLLRENVVKQDQTVSCRRLIGNNPNTKEPLLERLIKVVWDNQFIS